MKRSPSPTAMTATAAAPAKAPQQNKKQKKTKEKLAFDIPYDVEVPSLSDNAKINAIMGLIGQLIFATSNIPRPSKREPEEPPQKKVKIEGDEKDEIGKARPKKKEKTAKDNDGNDLRMFVVGVNAVSRIVEKDEATAKKKIRCVVVASPEKPASDDFVARHIAMCSASLGVPVCVLDTTSAELGKAFNVPSVMAFAVKTEEFYNETNNPQTPEIKQDKSESGDERGSDKAEDNMDDKVTSGIDSDNEENARRKKIADNLVSMITENQSKVMLPWSGKPGELKPLKVSPLKRNPARVKQHPKKKPQPQKKMPTKDRK